MFVHDQNIIKVDEVIRLRPLKKDDYKMALVWYSNDNILKYSENRSEAYDIKMIDKMYSYLSSIGLVFVIEYFEDKWHAIGDVTLSDICMPMVIMPAYQSKGIGYKIITRLLDYGKAKGLSSIKLSGIYVFNEKSYKLYRKCGFVESCRDDQKIYMEIDLC